LIEKVRAAIYLSLDELWSVPTDNTLIATFLDPRFKHFNWATLDERDKALQLVKTKYDTLKSSLHIPDDTELTEDKDQKDDDNDFFRDLEGDCTQTITDDDDEVSRYKNIKNIKVKDDPLTW